MLNTMFKPKDYLPKRIIVEIWGDKQPDKILGLNLNEERLLSKDRVAEVLDGWKNVASRFENPMITIQANINEGIFIAYENKNNPGEISPVCKSFTIKYAFDENIRPLYMSYDGVDKMPGHSLVYHSIFNSKLIQKELEKTVELFIDFFNSNGRMSDNSWRYLKKRNLIGEELVIDNKKLL